MLESCSLSSWYDRERPSVASYSWYLASLTLGEAQSHRATFSYCLIMTEESLAASLSSTYQSELG